jgi:hypothetical protein
MTPLVNRGYVSDLAGDPGGAGSRLDDPPLPDSKAAQPKGAQAQQVPDDYEFPHRGGHLVCPEYKKEIPHPGQKQAGGNKRER